jgi:hypothetical protein
MRATRSELSAPSLRATVLRPGTGALRRNLMVAFPLNMPQNHFFFLNHHQMTAVETMVMTMASS